MPCPWSRDLGSFSGPDFGGWISKIVPVVNSASPDSSLQLLVGLVVLALIALGILLIIVYKIGGTLKGGAKVSATFNYL